MFICWLSLWWQRFVYVLKSALLLRIYFGTADTILLYLNFDMYFGAIYVATKMLFCFNQLTIVIICSLF